ncbi:hypothetical protein PVAG01_09108 [Phlyctema vagabunda]|uniref:Uncharacterized protein n=1 Tax=Phlyctema vagabunda TaxID=108571 RepID=A0ABR4P6J8_9HELO
MLLTSSQVSVAISSTVIFLFTSALFLSGYVVQQKTVQDLRIAIKPAPRPAHEPVTYLPERFRDPDAHAHDRTQTESNAQVIEVNQLEGEARRKHKELLHQQQVVEVGGKTSGRDAVRKAEEGKRETPAERRKRIKDEIMEGSEEGSLGGYRPRRW